VSAKTGTRFTYRVKRKDQGGEFRPWFVSVLVGPQNEHDYQYLGCIFPLRNYPGRSRYFHGHKSKITSDALSNLAFAWTFQALEYVPHSAGVQREATLATLTQIEVWHEGRCGRCGRKLTVPDSIARGLGPECAGLS
jgi:hypothetical protein